MTVAQLIEELQKIEDKSIEVWADGCDCTNRVSGLTEEEWSHYPSTEATNHLILNVEL